MNKYQDLSEKDRVYYRLILKNQFRKSEHEKAFKECLKKALLDYSICLVIASFFVLVIIIAANVIP